MIRTTITAVGLGLLLSIGASTGALAAQTSVKGHLRDSYCFLRMGAHGASHHDCAMGCAKAGIPVLLVDDATGNYYVVLPPKNKEGLPPDVINKMEDEVTVTGTEYNKGGVRFITADSVK
jgi:hypothetical protein